MKKYVLRNVGKKSAVICISASLLAPSVSNLNVFAAPKMSTYDVFESLICPSRTTIVSGNDPYESIGSTSKPRSKRLTYLSEKSEYVTKNGKTINASKVIKVKGKA